MQPEISDPSIADTVLNVNERFYTWESVDKSDRYELSNNRNNNNRNKPYILHANAESF